MARAARFGSNRLSGHYAGVAAELGAYSERVEDPADVAAAIGRGIAATRAGHPVVLEMTTKEEPGFPAAAVLAAAGEWAGGRG